MRGLTPQEYDILCMACHPGCRCDQPDCSDDFSPDEDAILDQLIERGLCIRLECGVIEDDGPIWHPHATQEGRLVARIHRLVSIDSPGSLPSR
jgi:hypothetical protein